MAARKKTGGLGTSGLKPLKTLPGEEGRRILPDRAAN
jgi:hypothetical protein